MESDIKKALGQVRMPDDCERRIWAALGMEGSAARPRQKRWRAITAAVAAAVLMTGTAFAVAYQYGVLEVFFKGDTSLLEAYVQTAVSHAETEGYRLTVDSAVSTGQNVYAVITVEGLTDQAVDDLVSNRVIAEAHREFWGQDMVDWLMESGGAGPDTVWTCFTDSGEPTSGIMLRDLPAPSHSSRSWQVRIPMETANGQIGSGPISLWLSFMGRDYAVQIPTVIAAETVLISIGREVSSQQLGGGSVFIQSLELSPVGLSYMGTDQDENVSLHISFRMMDGQVVDGEQLGACLDRSRLVEEPDIWRVYYRWDTVLDMNQIQSVILGDTEFPLDGTQPKQAAIQMGEEDCPRK